MLKKFGKTDDAFSKPSHTFIINFVYINLRITNLLACPGATLAAAFPRSFFTPPPTKDDLCTQVAIERLSESLMDCTDKWVGRNQ